MKFDLTWSFTLWRVSTTIEENVNAASKLLEFRVMSSEGCSTYLHHSLAKHLLKYQIGPTSPT
jgi:hypothetical protein